MYVEDQDEDVEEEEEFHEVEEEKHKTSQESVGTSGDQKVNQSTSDSSKPTISQDIEHPQHQQQHQQQQQEQPLEETTSDECKDVQTEKNLVDDNNIEVEKTVEKEPSSEQSSGADNLPSSEQLLIAVETNSHNDTSSTTGAVNNNVGVSKNVDIHETEAPETAVEPKVIAPSFDWANIMMHSKTTDSESTEEISSSDRAESDDDNTLHKIAADLAEDTIDGIIQETQAKLKIAEDSSTLLKVKQEANGSSVFRDRNHGEAKPLTDYNVEADKIPHDGVADANKAEAESADTKEEENDGDKKENVDGDKEEEVEKKELDLDEDVKSPQYIPKKGVFYEHDDRSHDTDDKKVAPPTTKVEDETTEAKESNAGKKVASTEKPLENRRTNRRQRPETDRWGHDLFRNDKQKPKSKSELITAYGYDIRQERTGRNPTDGRAPRSNNNINSNNNNNNGSGNSNADRTQGSQDNQRSRQPKDARAPRQLQGTNNGSRERKPRRQNTKNSRNDGQQVTPNRRDGLGNRSTRLDNTRDLRETLDEKQAARAAALASSRQDQEQGSGQSRNVRTDSRGRRKTSRDRPTIEEGRLPPPNNVMPPITTWSSEDMMKAEAFGKKSPPITDEPDAAAENSSPNVLKERGVDGWNQPQASTKPIYQDRQIRNQDDVRHHQQQYNSRGRYQDRGEENHRPSQYVPRNQYHERSNQQHEWHRAGNFSPYAKSNENYIVKTQTFENSRLSQGSMSRTNNNRDLREVINERRVNNQQNFHNKMLNVDHHMNHRGTNQSHYQHQYMQQYINPHQQNHHHQQQQQQQMVQNQSHMLQHPHPHQTLQANQHQQTQRIQPQSPQQPQTTSNHAQQSNALPQQSRAPPTTQPAQPVAGQSRANLASSSATETGPDSIRLNVAATNDTLNSRPIVKTDSYTGSGMAAGHQHHTQLPQHSQNHRSMSSVMTQSGTAPSGSHIVPQHLGPSTPAQPQYYTPPVNSRDPAAAAALASAYHGYIPGGHPVMDPSRYHMTQQQLSDHGYLASGQTGDVATGSVIHHQGLYTDTSAGGPLANSAYLTQAGTSLSPTTNIPVTGAGTQPLPPVSYIHSQYPPPPYSNPYSQPQMNQPPPQSGYPYWNNYI